MKTLLRLSPLFALLAACGSSESHELSASPGASQSVDEATTKGMYRAYSQEERTLLWREHLTTAMTSASPEEAKFVRDLEARLSTVLGSAEAAAQEGARAVALLGEDRARTLLGEHALHDLLSKRFRELGTRAIVRPSSDGTEGTNCGDRWQCSDDCTCATSRLGHTYCSQGNADRSCQATSGGCGWLWREPCNCNQSSTSVNSCGGQTTLVGP